MLEPTDRRLLLESLRPPSGHDLDFAIGTTYSLDLLTLLTIPLSFSLFDWEDEEGSPISEPHALLGSLRRFADRMIVFCQAGEIAVPTKQEKLFSYLEQSVVEVDPPNKGGVFHPKLWIERFVAPGQPTQYRLSCLTRNITFDRSWDTQLVLEGHVIDRKNAISSNRPLGAFLKSLPTMTLRKLSEVQKKKIDQVAEEILRVRFTPPEGYSNVGFAGFGIDNPSPFPFDAEIDRLMIISPFLTDSFLNRVKDLGSHNILVSRLESLQTSNQKYLKEFKDVYVLREDVLAEPTGNEHDTPGRSLLQGLHAKLYVIESGRYARLLTGSANATDAAFERNVEFLAELVGTKGSCGIDRLMALEKGQAGLSTYLRPYTLVEKSVDPDKKQIALERLADSLKRGLAGLALTAKVCTHQTDGTYSIRLLSSKKRSSPLSPQGTVRVWPVTLRQDGASVAFNPTGNPFAEFGAVSLEALTSFYAFEITVVIGDRKFTSTCVLNIPLDGAPEDRKERLLRALLQNKKAILRFLFFLLADEEDLLSGLMTMRPGESGEGMDEPPGYSEPALFETLLRALSRTPRKLDDVAQLVEDIRKAADGSSLLPERFNEIWNPVWQARQEAKRD